MGKGEDKMSFADLGLSAKPPPSFVKSKKEKKFDKAEARKDKHARVAESAATIAKNKQMVELHAEFVRKEAAREAAEKKQRRLELTIEHIKARNERDEKAKREEAAQLEGQARVQAAIIERVKEETAAQREMAKLIAAREEELARTAVRAVHVPVVRRPEIEATRAQLPVIAEEQPIMEAVEAARGTCAVICGETGSGKTTQVPQFLWEAGYGHEEGAPLGRQGLIAVTEPRRVAAISMAQRVAEELNVEFGREVCYHVRYDNNLSPHCRLKFLTEGVLLKELSSDFLLSKYSAVVIDEAHERSVSCDILCGMLSRVVPLRQQMHDENPEQCAPLKLIIMSATMRVTDFRDNPVLFPRQPPFVNVEARRFPVSNHFSRTTELFRYVDEAERKVRQIHKKLPPGGILVFLSTQREIEALCRRLRQHYSRTRIRYESGQYRKHALLASRQRRGGGGGDRMGGDAWSDDDDDEKQEQDDEAEAAAERDEFGLGAAEYALEGDEDFAAADDDDDDDERGIFGRGGTLSGGGGVATAAMKKKQERRLANMRDDFDYTNTRRSAVPAGEGPGSAAKEGEKRTTRARRARQEGSEGHARRHADQDDEDDEEEDEEEDGACLAAADGEDEEDGALDTLHILPLYSLLSTAQQHLVFEPPPDGKRLCVVATNVAETSITIPNIRYVVDAGRVKCKTLDPSSGAAVYRIQWISQASAEQRSGRAGRTGPGHCYRLFSTAVFTNRMEKHAAPEILRTPLESVVLLMKQLRIDHVGSFPFPTPPQREALVEALRHLLALKAVASGTLRITPLGQRLCAFPVAPRFAHMINAVIPRLRSASKVDAVSACVLSAVAVASTTTDIFVRSSGDGEEGGGIGTTTTTAADAAAAAALAEASQAARELHHGGSDLITFGRALALYETSRDLAARAGLVLKSLQEASQLKWQLERVIAELRAADDASNGRDAANAPGSSSSSRGDRGGAGDVDAALQDFDNNEGAVVASTVPRGRQVSGPVMTAADIVRAQKRDRRSAAPPLTRDEETTFRQICAAGLVDQVARRASAVECAQHKIKYADHKTSKTPYFDFRTSTICFVHPTSSVAKTHPPPEFVVYCAMQRTRRVDGALAAEAKTFMKGVTIVTRQWLDAAGFVEDAPLEHIDM